MIITIAYNVTIMNRFCDIRLLTYFLCQFQVQLVKALEKKSASQMREPLRQDSSLEDIPAAIAQDGDKAASGMPVVKNAGNTAGMGMLTDRQQSIPV